MSALSLNSIVYDVSMGEVSIGYGTDLILDLYCDPAFDARIREILTDVSMDDLAVADAVARIQELI
jgi:hypothetical protein